ncbi:unnamed protein product [Clavelina lepadiformis]|uniref:Protein ARV n=1 Tax=Clavelina lepadiformis TaxID=159417 RepID=A0ABP0FH74_CLALP
MSAASNVEESSSQDKGKYVCVECEAPSDKLYSTFPGSGNVRIEHCKKCKEPVDRYIEHDVTLQLLDLLLLSKPVWRHVLINQETTYLHWKIAVICLFCNGYMKLITSSSLNEFNPNKSMNDDDFVFQAAKQVELYVLSFVSGLELMAYLLFVLFFNYLMVKCKPFNGLTWKKMRLGFMEKPTSMEIIRCLLLSGAGKLLFIPAIIWAQGESPLYLQMIIFYVMLCSSLAFSLIVNCSLVKGIFIIVLSNVFGISFIHPIDMWLRSLDLF